MNHYYYVDILYNTAIMADINSLFDCFEESTENESSVQLPNVVKDEKKL